MKRAHTQQFFDHRLIWIPDHLQKVIGQFNVYQLYKSTINKDSSPHYNREGLYMITLLRGPARFLHADRTLEIDNNTLIFSNPEIANSLEILDDKPMGFVCVFTEHFFNQLGNIKDYPIFKPGNLPLFELNSDQTRRVSSIFQKMLEEITSDFYYKYEVLRILSMELIHSRLKLNLVTNMPSGDGNAAERTTSLFMELLERQFPIASPQQRISLRHPVDFAEKLSIHINHLNRSLKNIAGKTTTQIITERIMKEAKLLLQQTDWSITEIARCLGFEELPHFINFFKKNELSTPKTFKRQSQRLK